MALVNAILSDHNVDKQMTDSRGEVGTDRLAMKCKADDYLGCILDG